MALFLRLDNDKPFGNATFLARVASKVREELWFPALRQVGYMHHADEFFQLLQEHGIKAHWYFRICTIPGRDFLKALLQSGHAVGLHAESTRCFEDFCQELTEFKRAVRLSHLHSFTKHGSGTLKLGRR